MVRPGLHLRLLLPRTRERSAAGIVQYSTVQHSTVQYSHPLLQGQEVDGCEMECEEGEILVPDPRCSTSCMVCVMLRNICRTIGKWFCVAKLSPITGGELQCPGAYTTGRGGLRVVLTIIFFLFPRGGGGQEK